MCYLTKCIPKIFPTGNPFAVGDHYLPRTFLLDRGDIDFTDKEVECFLGQKWFGMTNIVHTAQVIYELLVKCNTIHPNNARWFTLFDNQMFVRFEEKVKSGDIWKFARPTQYWRKEYWIFIINVSENHWVLVTVCLANSEILVFDSFAGDPTFWAPYLKVRHVHFLFRDNIMLTIS